MRRIGSTLPAFPEGPNKFLFADYPGLIPVGSQKLSPPLRSSRYNDSDYRRQGVHRVRKWRLLQVDWRDPLVPTADVDI
jgi:hypothetical protein